MAEKESLKEYTAEEVSKHTAQEDCWLVIGNESNGAFFADSIDHELPFSRLSVVRRRVIKVHCVDCEALGLGGLLAMTM